LSERPQHDAIGTYRSMVRMRAFEEAVRDAVAAGEIHGEMHIGLGQEAIAAGIEPLLDARDAVVSTHRPHLHALAHGVPPVPLLAELFERAGGLNGGKGGHMHLFARDRQFMCTGIVGASAPIALGYAFAFRRRREPQVAVAVLGDGAMNQGATAESFNLAAAWRLPVLFLVEDNGYGISVTREQASAGELVRRGDPYGIPGIACDGTDVEAVHDAAATAFARIRAGEGPVLLLATAYRYSGHYEGDPDQYRPKAEKASAAADLRDPLARFRQVLLERGCAEQDLVGAAERAREQVAEWFAAARAQPWPAPETAFEGVFA
jgi:pyruvate dehydrogenase E1 component alpha subunit